MTKVKAYRDDAALDRVWNRLESRRRRSSSPRPFVQLMAAAALLSGGIFVGMSVEQSRAGAVTSASVSSELLVSQGVPTGRSADSDQSRSGPDGEKKSDKAAEKSRSPRGLRHFSHLKIPTLVEELSPQEVSRDLAIVEVKAELPPSPPEWVLLADRGEYAAAFQRLDESGGFDGVLTTGSSEELMALADVARFVGRQGRAIQALRAVTDRFQGDPNAPLAAMIIGNLLSRAGDAQGAAEAYALNRRLSPGGDFAEDALVREFDMAMADGDLAGVERLRAQYEAEFSEGRHLPEMRADEARLLDHSQVEGSTSDNGSSVPVAADKEGNRTPSELSPASDE